METLSLSLGETAFAQQANATEGWRLAKVVATAATIKTPVASEVNKPTTSAKRADFPNRVHRWL